MFCWTDSPVQKLSFFFCRLPYKSVVFNFKKWNKKKQENKAKKCPPYINRKFFQIKIFDVWYQFHSFIIPYLWRKWNKINKKKTWTFVQVLWAVRGSNSRHSGCKPDARTSWANCPICFCKLLYRCLMFIYYTIEEI